MIHSLIHRYFLKCRLVIRFCTMQCALLSVWAADPYGETGKSIVSTNSETRVDGVATVFSRVDGVSTVFSRIVWSATIVR
jgi:hypothetical protein